MPNTCISINVSVLASAAVSSDFKCQSKHSPAGELVKVKCLHGGDGRGAATDIGLAAVPKQAQGQC